MVLTRTVLGYLRRTGAFCAPVLILGMYIETENDGRYALFKRDCPGEFLLQMCSLGFWSVKMKSCFVEFLWSFSGNASFQLVSWIERLLCNSACVQRLFSPALLSVPSRPPPLVQLCHDHTRVHRITFLPVLSDRIWIFLLFCILSI